MAAYKIRKILHNYPEVYELLNLPPDVSEDTIDINQLITQIYPEPLQANKINELEALAACCQTVFSQSQAHAPELRALEEKVLDIFRSSQANQPRANASNPSASPQQLTETPQASRDFEAYLLRCQTVSQLLWGLNAIHGTSCKYLGPKITLRSLQDTKPQSDLLDRLVIKQDDIGFDGDLNESVSVSEISTLLNWISQYINFCSSILPDFNRVLKSALSKKS